MSNQHDLNRIKPALRTKGTLTGNFGAGKRTAGSKLADVPSNQRETLGNFPTEAEYAERLRKAYFATSDRKLQAFIAQELGKIERRSINHGERVAPTAKGPHCSLSNHQVHNYQL